MLIEIFHEQTEGECSDGAVGRTLELLFGYDGSDFSLSTATEEANSKSVGN